jgi:hypothetical protein
MSLKINDSNYTYYKKIYEIIWSHYIKLFDPAIAATSNPVNVLNNWEKESTALAKRGLKAGLIDTVSSSKYFTLDLINDIETDLNRNGLPTLQILQSLIKDTRNKVLKRGKIKKLEEYYIIKELVVDLTTELSDQERILLGNYLEKFEVSTKKDNDS